MKPITDEALALIGVNNAMQKITVQLENLGIAASRTTGAFLDVTDVGQKMTHRGFMLETIFGHSGQPSAMMELLGSDASGRRRGAGGFGGDSNATPVFVTNWPGGGGGGGGGGGWNGTRGPRHFREVLGPFGVQEDHGWWGKRTPKDLHRSPAMAAGHWVKKLLSHGNIDPHLIAAVNAHLTGGKAIDPSLAKRLFTEVQRPSAAFTEDYSSILADTFARKAKQTNQTVAEVKKDRKLARRLKAEALRFDRLRINSRERKQLYELLGMSWDHRDASAEGMSVLGDDYARLHRHGDPLMRVQFEGRIKDTEKEIADLTAQHQAKVQPLEGPLAKTRYRLFDKEVQRHHVRDEMKLAQKAPDYVSAQAEFAQAHQALVNEVAAIRRLTMAQGPGALLPAQMRARLQPHQALLAQKRAALGQTRYGQLAAQEALLDRDVGTLYGRMSTQQQAVTDANVAHERALSPLQKKLARDRHQLSQLEAQSEKKRLDKEAKEEIALQQKAARERTKAEEEAQKSLEKWTDRLNKWGEAGERFMKKGLLMGMASLDAGAPDAMNTLSGSWKLLLAAFADPLQDLAVWFSKGLQRTAKWIESWTPGQRSAAVNLGALAVAAAAAVAGLRAIGAATLVSGIAGSKWLWGKSADAMGLGGQAGLLSSPVAKIGGGVLLGAGLLTAFGLNALYSDHEQFRARLGVTDRKINDLDPASARRHVAELDYYKEIMATPLAGRQRERALDERMNILNNDIMRETENANYYAGSLLPRSNRMHREAIERIDFLRMQTGSLQLLRPEMLGIREAVPNPGAMAYRSQAVTQTNTLLLDLINRSQPGYFSPEDIHKKIQLESVTQSPLQEAVLQIQLWNLDKLLEKLAKEEREMLQEIRDGLRNR